jgi:hypothetical protein
MDTSEKDKESLVDRIKAGLRDVVGLPPGDGTPHGKGRSNKADDAPRGSLTADDAENLPPHAGTGISVE